MRQQSTILKDRKPQSPRILVFLSNFSKIAVALLLGLIVVQPVSATIIRGGDKVIFAEDERIDDDLLLSAGVCEIDSYVDGDVLAFSRVYRMSGTISGVGVFFSERATLNGDISHSLLSFSRRILLSGTVRGSSYLFAQKVEIDEEALFSRDVTVFCDSLFMEGSVSGGLRCFVGSIAEISGSVVEDLEIEADKTLRILKTAHIGGDLIVHGTVELEIEDGAVIVGEVVRLDDEEVASDGFSFGTIFKFFFTLSMLFTLAGVTLTVSRSHFERSTRAVTKETLRSFAFGLIALTAGIVATMVLAITLVGILTAAILFIIIVFIVALLGPIYTAGGIGALIVSSKNGAGIGVILVRLFIGLFILLLLTSIPYLGVVIYLLAGMLGFGSFIIGAMSPKVVVSNVVVSKAVSSAPPRPDRPSAETDN